MKSSSRLNSFALNVLASLMCGMSLVAPALAITALDREKLDAAAKIGTSSQVQSEVKELVRKFGKQRDMEALDTLISRRDIPLLAMYFWGWRDGGNVDPAVHRKIELLAIEHFADEDVAKVLIEQVGQYEDPRLFELYFQDVTALSKLRAQRRKNCVARIEAVKLTADNRQSSFASAIPPIRSGRPEPQQERYGEYSISWNHFCGKKAEDTIVVGLDGLSAVRYSVSRQQKSLEAITRTEIPGIETRLAPLIRDLVLYPKPDWSVVGEPPAGAFFPTVRNAEALFKFLDRRQYAVPTDDLIFIFSEYAAGITQKPAKREDLGMIPSFFALACDADSVDATKLAVSMLPKVLSISDEYMRAGLVGSLIPKLGPILPAAQTDLSQVRKLVLPVVPFNQVTEIERLLKQVEDENRSLSAPDTDSLSRWIGSRYARRIVPYLLERGADPNGIPRVYIHPPLVAAAARRDVVTLQMLLAKGANVNQKGRDGLTALHAAATGQNADEAKLLEIVKILLARGADANAVSSTGATPLHQAAGNAKIAKLLLDANAKVDAKDSIDSTPLRGYVIGGNIDALRVLLVAGANPNIENRAGESPYSDSLQSYRKPEVRALLEQYGGKLSGGQRARRVKEEAVGKLLLPFLR
jgi:Ankyrin repeats (3 copies)